MKIAKEGRKAVNARFAGEFFVFSLALPAAAAYIFAIAAALAVARASVFRGFTVGSRVKPTRYNPAVFRHIL